MKQMTFVLLLVLVLLGGCISVIEEEKNMMYFGEGEEWFAVYTVSNVKNFVYDSLYIQYTSDFVGKQRVKELEYSLTVGEKKLSSSYPQPIEGVGNFHTASKINPEFFSLDYPDQAILELSWQDQAETIVLVRQ